MKISITLNINIGDDGKVTISSDEIQVAQKPAQTTKNESPFRFVNPDYIETWDRGNSAHLPNIPYKVLRYVCESADLCAEIEEMARSLNLTKDTIDNSLRISLSPTFKKRGFQWRISRRNGYIFLIKNEVEKLDTEAQPE